MSDPTLALQVALLARLQEVLSVPVYDAVPQETAYPYVTLGTSMASNVDATNERIDLRFYYLSIWSRAYGQAEILGIMTEIDTLNDSQLPISTGDVGSLRVARKQTIRDSDELTFQGLVTLQIYTTH